MKLPDEKQDGARPVDIGSVADMRRRNDALEAARKTEAILIQQRLEEASNAQPEHDAASVYKPGDPICVCAAWNFVNDVCTKCGGKDARELRPEKGVKE